jgi:hypothetical protein
VVALMAASTTDGRALVGRAQRRRERFVDLD